MRPIRPKFTIFRAALAVAVAAILCFVVTEPIKRRALDRHHRLLEIAAGHGSLAGEYARNSAGAPGMLKIAAWHDHMRLQFRMGVGAPRRAAADESAVPARGLDGRREDGRSRMSGDVTAGRRLPQAVRA